ncbi:glutamyl-tRNA reductase [Cellulomonas sp. KRMCY2]|uniref:glutamyl-tRNA reductase n=1 Tax=Cellulomonas sp. KRMCY2 TaxID=1304865 RepID=UPI0004B47458|nr:glutamyl-tRNA reductase [Cellulomonas sp. KRMCY2]
MTLTASHRDLDLDVLEQLSSGAHSVGSTVVSDSQAITGCVVLATCNRFEVYLDTGAAADRPDGVDDEVVAAAIAAIAKASGLRTADVAAALQAGSGPAVARHLFAVASGLDSMVVGEREVAGQVRRALQAARAQGTTSPRLERLFQTASRTSRAVGSRTGLAGTGRSVVGVALDLATHELARHDLDLVHARVLLVGTGSYAGASLTALRARGAQDLVVHSPSGRAAEFAADRGLAAVVPGTLPDELARADVVVSCSGALGPVIDTAMVAAARERSTGADGRARPVVLVDLALRHDIDPRVVGLPGVRLIDLAAVQRHSPATVTPAVEAGRLIVAERAADFERELDEQLLVPAVVALRGHVDQVLEAEVERVRLLARAKGADPASVEQVERSLRRFAAAVLHTPSVRAREHARAGRHAEYRAGLEALFGIDVPLPGDSGSGTDGDPRPTPRHRAD